MWVEGMHFINFSQVQFSSEYLSNQVLYSLSLTVKLLSNFLVKYSNDESKEKIVLPVNCL